MRVVIGIRARECDAGRSDRLPIDCGFVVKGGSTRNGEQVSIDSVICVGHRCCNGGVVHLVAGGDGDGKRLCGDGGGGRRRRVLRVVGCVCPRDGDACRSHCFSSSNVLVGKRGGSCDREGVA